MRIKSLDLCNFRQFYGLQTIEFSGGSPEDDTNVTVVCGENGRGKTGLYRALMYCMYGEKDLDQDRTANHGQERPGTKGLYLVNLAALDEDAASGRRGVEAFVRASFVHNGRSYKMSRRLFGMLGPHDEVIEEQRGAELAITDGSGNTEILGAGDEDRIIKEVNGILDTRVKDYFLFDGERIERLTKVTEQQKKEVSSGIRNLLKIDDLYKAERVLQGLDLRLTRELQKVSTGDYRKKLHEKEQLMGDQDALSNDLENTQRELEFAENHLRELDAEFERFKENAELILERKALEAERDNLQSDIDGVRAQMRKFTSGASILLAEDVLDQVYVDIDQKRERGQVPSEIKKELIERLLHELRCICGREVAPGSAEYHMLKAWDLETPSAGASSDTMALFGRLGRTSQYVDTKAAELIELLQRRGELDEYLDDVELRLEDLVDKLSTLPDTDLANKTKARETTAKKIWSLEVQLGEQRERASQIEEDLDRIKRELVPLRKQSQEHQQISQQLELVSRARDSLKRIIAQFVREVREELEERANDSFRRLLDVDGQKTLQRLQLKGDYTLEVLDQKNRSFLANISAGQRQIVSLSFITALAQVAGGASTLEVPLFMDTPFGRLSYEHRENLLVELPRITPQWVLLATETELGDREREQLRRSGKWGRYYYLKAEGEYVTKITELSVGNPAMSGALNESR